MMHFKAKIHQIRFQQLGQCRYLPKATEGSRNLPKITEGQGQAEPS